MLTIGLFLLVLAYLSYNVPDSALWFFAITAIVLITFGIKYVWEFRKSFEF